MTTITIELTEDQDLSIVEEGLNKMGLKFRIDEDEDWSDLPEAAIEGIKAGLADIESGRTYSHEYVMSEMKKTMEELRQKNA